MITVLILCGGLQVIDLFYCISNVISKLRLSLSVPDLSNEEVERQRGKSEKILQLKMV